MATLVGLLGDKPVGARTAAEIRKQTSAKSIDIRGDRAAAST